MDLATVTRRDKLKPRRDPYWHKLAVGEFLGFRKMTGSASGSWIARAYDAADRAQRHHALGTFDHLPASERFDAASKAARDWFKHLNAGGQHEVITVRQACERYAEHLLREKGQTQADEARARFGRYVSTDPIASIPLPKLKKTHVEAWRTRLCAHPAVIARKGKGKGRGKGDAVIRKRSPATINRDMVALRAALNLALADGYALSALPWRGALKPLEAKGRRNLYLDRAERRRLLEHLPDEAAAFVRALCLLPLRPGAVAALRVQDFKARQNTLHIERDKAGESRVILLPPDTAALLKEAARGKLPAAHLFARWDGRPWDKESWKKPIKQAVIAAELPASASAYTLRHSVITDLITDGLDLFTVAQISGTSVAMIEKHYGHLRRDRARDALASLNL